MKISPAINFAESKSGYIINLKTSEIKKVLGFKDNVPGCKKFKNGIKWSFTVELPNSPSPIRCGIWDYYGDRKLWSFYGPRNIAMKLFPNATIGESWDYRA